MYLIWHCYKKDIYFTRIVLYCIETNNHSLYILTGFVSMKSRYLYLVNVYKVFSIYNSWQLLINFDCVYINLNISKYTLFFVYIQFTLCEQNYYDCIHEFSILNISLYQQNNECTCVTSHMCVHIKSPGYKLFLL